MKRVLMVAGCAAIAAAGCVTQPEKVAEIRSDAELPGVTSVEAKQVHLKSVLGINDVVLADTNRFMLGNSRYCYTVKFDKPFGGFAEASVFLDERDVRSGRTPSDKPHRLYYVSMTRMLPDVMTVDEMLAEWRAACRLVSDILDMETPKVMLADLDNWRENSVTATIGSSDGIESSLDIKLGGNQDITVTLTEPVYAVRNGKAILLNSGSVRIDLAFNRTLDVVPHRMDFAKETIEKEIDFGPDCRDQLADALKNAVERRARARQRHGNIDGGKAKSQ